MYNISLNYTTFFVETETKTKIEIKTETETDDMRSIHFIKKKLFSFLNLFCYFYYLAFRFEDCDTYHHIISIPPYEIELQINKGI